jgi:hypothetical protein
LCPIDDPGFILPSIMSANMAPAHGSSREIKLSTHIARHVSAQLRTAEGSLESRIERMGASIGRLAAAFRQGIRQGAAPVVPAARNGAGSDQDPQASVRPANPDGRSFGLVTCDPEIHPPLEWYADPVGSGVAG